MNVDIKNKPKPKQRKQQTVVEAVGKTKAKKKVAPSGLKVRRDAKAKAYRNSYLDTLLDPEHCTGVGVPDFNTMPSVKFQTNTRHNFSCPATNSWIAFAVAPTLAEVADGGYNTVFLGGTPAGNSLNLLSVSAATAAVATLASGSNFLLSFEDADLIQNNFSAIRPVSMAMTVMNADNITTAQGQHGMTLLPVQQFPCTPDSVQTNNGGGLGGNVAGATGYQQGAPANVGDLMDAMQVLQPTTQTVRCVWSPEDPSDYDYMPVNPAGDQVGSASPPTTVLSQFIAQSWTNTVTSEGDVYIIPSGITITTPVGGGEAQLQWLPDGKPYILYCASGLKIGETQQFFVTLTTNWEAIPRSAIGSRMGVTPSPSNPDELTQATNVVQMIPDASAPNLPNDTNTRLQQAALGTAPHLYDGTSRKEALEGTSISKTIGKGLGVAAPFLGAVPGVGTILSMGASFLSTLLS